MTAEPMLGTLVGAYRIRRLLGEGGMGRVYAADDERTGFQVAIKIISEEHAGSPSLVERFFAEAHTVNLIAHEHIVAVHDLARLPDGRPYIVMDLLEGSSAREIVRMPRPSLGGIVHVLLDVLGALAAAHAVGVIHRDLKPDNVLVDRTGRAKLLDFGIAKLVGDTTGTPLPRTRTGALLGTPEYMAPEQIESKVIDGRTDLYALGVLAFELFAGRRPFEGASDFELMRAHVEDPPPDLRSLRPDLPAPVASVITTALAKNPAHRFQSAHAMAAALYQASSTLPDDAWGPLLPGSSPRPRAALALPRADTNDAAPSSTLVTGAAHRSPSSSAVTRAQRPTPRPQAKPGNDDLGATRRDGKPPPSRRGRLLIPLVAVGAVASIAAIVVVTSAGSQPSTPPGPQPIASADPPAPGDAQTVLVVTPPAVPIDAALADASPVESRVVRTTLDGGLSIRDASVVTAQIVDAAVPPPVDAATATATATAPTTTTTTTVAPIERKFQGLDAVADIAKIYALAREMVPQAELTRVRFWGVRADAPNVSAEYSFRSPRRDASPCAVRVSLTSRWEERKDPNGLRTATARVDKPLGKDPDPCIATTIHAPRCLPQKIMAIATAVPGLQDVRQDLTWTGEWTFRAYDPNAPQGARQVTRTLPDECPGLL